MRRTYTIVLEPQADGSYSVAVPALPEIATQGATREQAIRRAKECISFALEARLADGEELPAPDVQELVTVDVPVAS